MQLKFGGELQKKEKEKKTKKNKQKKKQGCQIKYYRNKFCII